jgi:CRISPR-associated protein Cst2
MNLAKALDPYRHNAVFTQSPQDKTPKEVKSHVNVDKSQLLHRETVVTAFQYPFALNLSDCQAQPDWSRKLLKAVGELNDVAGNHARSYFEMAPASIVLRLTTSLVAGYNTYGFQTTGKAPDEKHHFREVVEGIVHEPPDYPGNEFYLGGKIVKEMADEVRQKLEAKGVTLERDPRKLLQIVADKAFRG